LSELRQMAERAMSGGYLDQIPDLAVLLDRIPDH
jgi:hypothetical protein